MIIFHRRLQTVILEKERSCIQLLSPSLFTRLPTLRLRYKTILVILYNKYN